MAEKIDKNENNLKDAVVSESCSEDELREEKQWEKRFSEGLVFSLFNEEENASKFWCFFAALSKMESKLLDYSVKQGFYFSFTKTC